MFVTNWISTTKIQKISEITNFFRHYFLSRTEVVVRLKGVVTRLSRSAEPSGNLREAVSFNSRSSLLKLKETSLWTQRNVFFRLFNHILSLIQTSEYAYSNIWIRLFNHNLLLIQTSEFSSRTIFFPRKSRMLCRTYLSGGRWRCRLGLKSYLLAGHWDYR